MKKYYIQNGTVQEGPFDKEELKNKNLNAKSPIWYDGLAEWAELDKVEELKDLVHTSSPPPFPPEKKLPPPIINNSTSSSNQVNTTQAPPKKKSKVLLFSIILIVLIIGGIAVVYAINSNSFGGGSGNYYENVMSIEETERLTPSNFLSDKSTYRPALLGNKWVIEGTISSNATVVTYKNIVLKINFYGDNGVLLGSNEYTVNNRISPNQTIEYKAKLEGFDGTKSIGVGADRADTE